MTISMETPHLSILASAGSGKTYQLTNRYLGLLAGDVEPRRILASTFTRLAAGEIRDRILGRLTEAHERDDKRAELAAAIGRSALGRDEIPPLLRRMVSNLHRLQVRTLDSFFGAVVHAFAIELDVPPGCTILDESGEARLRTEAIRRLLDADDAGRLTDLLRGLTLGRSERSVMRVIDDVIVTLAALARGTAAGAWTPVTRRVPLDAAALEVALAAFAAAAAGAKPSVEKSCAKAIAQAREGDWDGLLGAGVAKNVAQGQDTYGRVALEPDLVAARDRVVRHAIAQVGNRILDQTRAARDLLERYEAQLRVLRAERRVMSFDDLTALTAAARDRGTFEEICFRLDATIDHLLLDEFQDTSVEQWRALEPIVREIIGDETTGRTFFCVGDTKQSIYGWRGAEPDILAGLPGLLAPPGGEPVVTSATLVKSWRSSPPVIDAVNTVFEGIATNAALAEQAGGADAFAVLFETHETERTALPGRVELWTCPEVDAEGEETRRIVRLRTAARLVADLHRAAPRRRIAVLARSNAAVARVLFELQRDELGVPASGRGGGPLTDESAVNAVLDLLRLADHPGDTVAAFHVARGPLGALLDFPDEQDATRRRRVAAGARRELLDRGAGAFLARLARGLAPSCDARGFRRLLQLAEVAGEIDDGRSLRPGELVAAIEARSVALTEPSAVEVMTIHQSKGLEFDDVVLADLEWPLASTAAYAYERDSPVGDVSRICRWLNQGLRDLLPEVRDLFDVHVARTVRESLCLLYVAMTRAAERLYMVIDTPNVRQNGTVNLPATAAGVLRAAFVGDDVLDAGACVHAHGTDDPARFADREDADAAATDAARATPAPPVAFTFAAPRHAMPRGAAAPPPSAHAEAEARLASRLRILDPEPRERGTVLHALFEEIAWLEDFDADDAALDAVVRRLAPRRDDAWRRDILRRFRAALARPAVDVALRRGDRAHPRVWRERTFARLVDDGRRLQQGAIDRLVVEHDADGTPLRAEVLDFKTDAVTAGEVPERAETYRTQVEHYREVATGLVGVEPSAVRSVLLFVGPGVAVHG